MSDRHFEARVLASYGRRALIASDGGLPLSALSKNKNFSWITGDRVHCIERGQEVIAESILPRTNLFFRAEGHRSKALAANIDQVAIVFASEPSFQIEFIWRALLAARASAVPAFVILNKSDLATRAAAERCLATLHALGHDAVLLSAKRAPEQARALLHPRLQARATLLVGQSGMGKSTLLNVLVPEAQATTQEFSIRLNAGKQTTTVSRWHALDGIDGAVVDTPGFARFGLAHLTRAQITEAMPDVTPFLGQCRFNDCVHNAEPDCAITRAVAQGAIAPARYAFLRTLLDEIES